MSASEFRANAEAMRAQAAKASDPDTRDGFLKLAEGWDQLASHAERFEQPTGAMDASRRHLLP